MAPATDSPNPDGKSQLRRRLFEIESEMDQIRRDPIWAGELGPLAQEREEVKTRLQDLDPRDVELGYQRQDEGFAKIETDGRVVSSPGEAGGAGF